MRSLRTILALAALSVSYAGVGEAIIAPPHHYTKEPSAGPSIRVLVAYDLPKAMVGVEGSFHLMDPNKNSMIGRRIKGSERTLQPQTGGLRWGELFPGMYQLVFVPENSKSFIMVDGVRYKGNVTFYDVDGSLSVVAEMPIEYFIAGQLSHQLANEQLDPEAIAALAIAARSNAYYLAEHPRSTYFDVDARNIRFAVDDTSTGGSAQQAVTATRFMVLTEPVAGSSEVNVPAIEWTKGQNAPTSGARTIRVSEASSLAQSGAHAAKILEQVFPGTTIQRMYDDEASK